MGLYLIQMGVWCASATDVQPRERKTGCAWRDDRESSDASRRQRFRAPLDKGPVNGCPLFLAAMTVHGKFIGRVGVESGSSWDFRSRPRTGHLPRPPWFPVSGHWKRWLGAQAVGKRFCDAIRTVDSWRSRERCVHWLVCVLRRMFAMSSR